ncbi:hypothetical protein [Streptomyces sp. NPDC020681]|uniref:hypothetical protein n=1 Tax=Streptomyces sp. NPDC020681 TaxID=3365083 RepID=UPI0037A0F6F4
MTGVIVTFFVLAALMSAFGLARQRRLHRWLTAWRHRDPAANEPSDAAFRVGRVMAFVMAGFFAFSGCRAMDFADGSSWDLHQVRSVAVAAASSLGEGASAGREVTRSELDEAVQEAAEGIGPFHELEVKPSGDDNFQLATVKGEYPFCLAVTSSRTGGFAVPGADGSTTILPEYGRSVTVEPGECQAGSDA